MAGIDLKLILTPSFSVSVFTGTLALCLAASAISFRRVASLDPALPMEFTLTLNGDPGPLIENHNSAAPLGAEPTPSAAPRG